IAAMMRRIVFPLGRPYFVPSDALGPEVAKLLLEPSATRDRLTAGMYAPTTGDNPVAQIGRALAATLGAGPSGGRRRGAPVPSKRRHAGPRRKGASIRKCRQAAGSMRSARAPKRRAWLRRLKR